MATLTAGKTQRTVAANYRANSMLLATDATAETEAATAMAMRLSEATGRRLRALSIVEPFYFGAPELGSGIPPEGLERGRMDARSDQLRESLKRVDARRDVPVEVHLGLPGAVIAREAQLNEDDLIVLGLGRHRLSDRLMGRETALQVTRFGSTPVLAVPTDASKLPTSAIVAVDFSEHSVRAAQAALAVLPSLSWIYLVHVAALDGVNGNLLQQLEEFGHSLNVGETITLQYVTLNSDDVAESLLRFAGLSHADIVVAGTHGRGFFARLVHGSVSTSLVRGAQTMVLVVPPPAPVPSVPVAASDPQAGWTDTLVEFNSRNVGRTCTLEVDDPLLGAQLQAVGYTFLGADYDHTDGRVALMLGSIDGGIPHLTRYVPGVRSLDSVRRESGVETLQLSHDLGQTLVTVS